MNKNKTLLENYELIHKEVKKIYKLQKEKESIEKCISFLSSDVDCKEIISKHEDIFIQTLINLLNNSIQLDLLTVNLIHILMIQELIPLYFYEQLLMKFQLMKRNEIISIKIIQIMSSILTNSLVTSLPVNIIYNGLKLLSFMSTTPLLMTSVHTIFTFLGSTASSFYPSIEKPTPKEFITLKEANRMIDKNENYFHKELVEPTQPLLVALTKFLNDLCLLPEFIPIREIRYQLMLPILAQCSNLFYQVKSLYSLMLQILIPQMPEVKQATMEYHKLFMTQYCTFPGYPQSLVDGMKHPDYSVLSFFYHFFSSYHSSFIINKHFEPMLLYFLQHCAPIAKPTSFDTISSPENLNQLAYFSYYVLISHLFTMQTESSPVVVDLTLFILYRFEVSQHLLVCIEKLLRIVIINKRSIVELVGIANQLEGGWNSVVNILIELNEYLTKEEWKCILKTVANNHWQTIPQITCHFNDTVLMTVLKELEPFVKTNNLYYHELFSIYELNPKRLSLFHSMFSMTLKKAFFEESSSTNDIMKMIENCLQKIISLTNDSINENNNDKEQKEIKEIQNQSLSLMLNFIIELLQDNNCLSIYFNSFLDCIEIIFTDDLDLIKHMKELRLLFTLFSKSNKAVVIKSFNLLKECVELLQPKDIPLDLIQLYIKQGHDINITLSAIQIYSDLILKLPNEINETNESIEEMFENQNNSEKNDNEKEIHPFDIYLNILKHIYFCVKDDRYDNWSGSLKTLIQAFAWKGELIQTNVDEFLKTILFPLIKYMKQIYFKLTNTEMPMNKMTINLYLQMQLRQWNENVCEVVGGLTRILKYILPFVSLELKEEMYDHLIDLIQISLCNAGLLICEVIMKYCNALIQASRDDQQIYEKIVAKFMSIGDIIQETNGVNATVSENYLITAKKIIETHQVESIVLSSIKYVNVFPDDFAIHSSGVSVLHNFIFEILDYMIQHYQHCEMLYINCLCSMMKNMNGEYGKRAKGCINNCLVVCYKKLSEIITVDIVKSIELKVLIEAIQSSRELFISMSTLENDFYSTIVSCLNTIVHTIGKSGNEIYCDLFYEVYLIQNKETLNEKLYQQYDKAYELLYEVICNNYQESKNEYIILKCLMNLKYNGYYDNLLPCKEQMILKLIEQENELGKYTQTQLIIHLIDELEYHKTIIEEYKDETHYQVQQCINHLKLISKLIEMNKYQLDKKSLYLVSVQFISSQYVSIRNIVVDILSQLHKYMSFN